MSLDHKLQKMKGKTFLFKTEPYKIIDYELTEEKILISTDRKLLKINKTEKALEDFLPVEDERNNNKGLVPFQFKGDDRLLDLKKAVTEAIDKIKTDANYIPQAKTILAGVQVFTNMVKVEVDIARLAKKNNL
jgi:hypothetical protein